MKKMRLFTKIHLLLLLITTAIVALQSCSDDKRVTSEIKDHRFEPSLKITSNGTTTDDFTEIQIGNHIELSISINNTNEDSYTLTPVISGNATLYYKDSELKPNTSTKVDLPANGILQLKLDPKTAGEVALSIAIKNEKQEKKITHKVNVLKSAIEFSLDKDRVESYPNAPATFTLSMKAPKQGLTYKLTVEKLEGKGTLSTATQRDISHNAEIEIPSSHTIPFSYLTTESGKHSLRFTITDNTGDKKSQNIEIIISKTNINFSFNKEKQEVLANNAAPFTLSITPPIQGTTYKLKVEKLEGKGTLSTASVNDIAHNADIEIPSSYTIPFSYVSSESGKHLLHFTITDQTGDKKSQNIEITVSKSDILFTIDKQTLETFTNTTTNFTAIIEPPAQGIKYKLKVEKLEGKGTLSTASANDIAHNADIEIPSSYIIPFSYISKESSKQSLRFTVTDNAGGSKSQNVDVNVVNSDYVFDIKTPQPLLKPNDVYPIIIKAYKSGYLSSKFDVKYILTEGSGNFQLDNKLIETGSNISITKDVDNVFTFVPTKIGDFTLTFITTIDNEIYERTLKFNIREYKLTVSSNNPSWGSVTGSGSYLHNTEVLITTSSAPHYYYEGIYNGNSQITKESQYKLKTDKDYNLTARFAPILYDILVTSSVGGSARADQPQYSVGENATLRATPSKDYTFSHWLLDGTNVSTTNPYIHKVSKSVSFQAVFVPKQHKVEVRSTGNGEATILNNNTGYVNHNGSLTLKAIPSLGYHSIGWWDNLTHLSQAAEHTVNNITTSKVFTAKFELNNYTFNCTAAAGGSVNPSETNKTYPHGTGKILSATSHISHTFSHWTLNGVRFSNSPSISITITENSNYVAVFAIRTFSVTLENNGSTRSTPSANPITVGYGSSTTLSPNTHSDDYFLGWKLKGQSNFIYANSVNNITSDTHVIAHYRNNTINVTHKRESAYSVYVSFSEILANDIEVVVSFDSNSGATNETTIVRTGTKSVPIRISDKAANLERYFLSIRKVSSSDTYKYNVER